MAIQMTQVTTMEDCECCHHIAAEVWGTAAACSTAQMVIHANYGGVVLLARKERNPVGFLFSFPALYRGEMVLWSHETALLPAYMHQGIGTLLKQEQRRLARTLGYQTIAWTFDPLVARNAYFNLIKLGARVDAYKVNAYGVDLSDRVNQGIETDRFIAVWPVVGEAAPEVGAGGDPVAVTEIPGDFSGLVGSRPGDARKLRFAFRETAQRLFADGLRPTGFQRTQAGGEYLWTRESDGHAH